MSTLIKRLLFGIGLILTGLILSHVELHPSLLPLQTYESEIFYTNCLVLCTFPLMQSRPTSPSRSLASLSNALLSSGYCLQG